MADKKKKSKLNANRLVSKYITEIAKESNELIEVDGESRMGTKAEALARLMWKHTLGFTELDVKTQKEVVHLPSLSWAKMLVDRMEGKVQDVSATQAKKSIADRVSDATKSSINSIADKSK